ncbi:MAG: YncE family protein, partial [Acidobacteria bacterium]|nr:YncE family protein [Acidobacteriota bacterium]
MKRFLLAAALVLAAASLIVSKSSQKEIAGPLPGGGFLLVSGWKIQAAGRQVPVDTFPMSAVLSRDGRHLLVLNGGYKPPSISVIDIAASKETSRVSVKDGWLGLAISAKGDTVWAGGGQQAAVIEFGFQGGALTQKRLLPISSEPRTFIGDVALAPDGRTLYATNLYHDSVARIDLDSGKVVESIPTGRRPYRIVFHPDGQSFLVSSWGDNVVVRHDDRSGKILARADAGAHPTDMLWDGAKRLFVAAANTNYVSVLDANLKAVEKINVSMTPRQPLGMTPSALALDQGRLYVVCSDANAIAVADVSKPKSRVMGFIPAGWYPTGVTALGGGRLAVLNGRGLRSYPNPQGPQPVRTRIAPPAGTPEVQYVGRLQTGTVSLLDPFDDRQLAAHTKTVMANSPYRDKLLERVETGRHNPVP